MKYKFNQNYFFSLLKEQKELERQGDSLRTKNLKKHKDLLNYLMLFQDQIFWEKQPDYFQLVNLFVTEQINLKEFRAQFHRLRSSNFNQFLSFKKRVENQIFDVLGEISPIKCEFNPIARGFSDLISNIHSLLEIVDSDVTLEMNLEKPDLMEYGLSEDIARKTLKDNYLSKLQDYGKKS